VLGHAFYGYYSTIFESILVWGDCKRGGIQLSIDGISIKVGSLDEFNNVCEVLVEKVYSYFINNTKKDIVFDVGMNIGDAVLFFLSDPKVEKIYAYEPFKDTFASARENLKEYLDDTDRLEIFQFGISDKNEVRKIGFNEGMTCGQSTVESIRQTVYEEYYANGLVKPENEQTDQIEVKDAVDVFNPIFEKYSNDNNMVLKMDCEGEEYGIIRELYENALLEKFDYIMLEWHYKGKEEILKYLNKSGFSYLCVDISNDMGSIYAYHMQSR
ncbi:MAG: FkbM family methyltransferase, partial [Lachnospiraceae bacterium]|nr:FkbM family methyltransferase [Lachnospiraceae bacterium]